MNLPHAEERCEAPRLEARTAPMQSELALEIALDRIRELGERSEVVVGLTRHPVVSSARAFLDTPRQSNYI